MVSPIYAMSQGDPPVGGNGHVGLWYDRFFNRYDENWQLSATAKFDWIKAVAGKVGEQLKCEAATHRLSELCIALGGGILVHNATWHFATGLGNPHPVENGFLWHPTLGTPYIPGAAVKGLARSWVESWMEFPGNSQIERDELRRDTLYRWFGSENKASGDRSDVPAEGTRSPRADQSTDTEAGAFIFFDALPIAPVSIKPDVMTPHMGDWYESGGEISSVRQSSRIPADWHDPVPVAFLVADKPKFQFAIAPRTIPAKSELHEIMMVLSNALEYLGAGAKTAVGYGIMDRNREAEQAIHSQAKTKREATQRNAAIALERARMDPLEREIALFLDARTDRNQSPISALINGLKTRKWEGEVRYKVVQHLEALMRQTRGQWKPSSEAKRPERDGEHQNTLLTLQWLDEGKAN